MKWPHVPLGHLSVLGPQYGANVKAVSPTGNGPRYVRITDIDDWGRLRPGSLSEPDGDDLDVYLLDDGDILLARSGATVGKSYLYSSADGPCVFAGYLIRFRPDEQIVEPRYVRYFLQTPSYWSWIASKKRVAAQPNVNGAEYASLKIPLPPPKEQRRIVEILDQADALRKLRAEADVKAERILPALFIKMFGDPATNPMGWDSATLGDLAADLRYGTSKRCHTDAIGTPVLRIPNIIHGEVDTRDLKYCELPEKELRRFALKTGDLLFVRTNGNPDYVGRCAVFEDAREYLYASYLIRARLDAEVMEPRFVSAFLRTPLGRRAMAPFIRTTAGQSNINTAGLRQILVPLPPMELQRRFRDTLDDLKHISVQRHQGASRLDGLFATLLYRAFTGDLTASWREAHMKELLQEMEQQAKALKSGTDTEVQA